MMADGFKFREAGLAVQGLICVKPERAVLDPAVSGPARAYFPGAPKL